MKAPTLHPTPTNKPTSPKSCASGVRVGTRKKRAARARVALLGVLSALLLWMIAACDSVAPPDEEQVELQPEASPFLNLSSATELGPAGTIEAWGQEWHGVGDPPTEDDFVAISASYHNLALREGGTIEAWSRDDHGEVSDTPTEGGFVAVSAGTFHSLALHENGTLEAWGFDNFEQISDTPTEGGFVAISAGGRHNLALREDGTLEVWGYDGDGQVSDTPTGDDFVAVAAGFRHNLALREDGTLEAWGRDRYEQVSDTPTEGGFVAVAAGALHSVAIKRTSLSVDIEIKPGDSPNSINMKSQGMTPVAILSDADFDAPSQVERSSLTFGATGEEESLHLRGRDVPNCGEEDVNDDGLDDLVCQFETQETGFEAGDEEGVLRGETTSGMALEGQDEVRAISPGAARNGKGPR